MADHSQNCVVRERISLNRHWRFQRCDESGSSPGNYASLRTAWLQSAREFLRDSSQIPDAPTPLPTPPSYGEKEFDDSDWRSLDLPHDWGIEGPFDQELEGATGKRLWWGRAWYRRTLHVPSEDEGSCLYLDIDGAMSYATVWVNGRFAGGWPYGYASFRIDLTPHLIFGSDNTIAIHLDNPPLSSRWYPGGGLYRNVWLVKTSPVHVAHWGTRITTPEVNYASASVEVKVEIENGHENAVRAIVQTRIYDRVQDGTYPPQFVFQSEPEVLHLNGRSRSHVLTSGKILRPRLWTVGDAYRYLAVTTVTVGKKVVDRYETPFGIRSFRFDSKQGLFLNNEPFRVHGVCNHHDLGALGAALNVSALHRQLMLLQEMGVNSIRTTHNPPAPELLDLCDRMGLLVIVEAFDCWKAGKTENDYHLLFDDWHEADLRAMIRHHANHPCVMLWSTGNEILEQRDPADHHISRHLTDIVHDEDPSRPATAGCNVRDAGFNGFQNTVDVFGFNYKPFRYSEFHQTSPDIPFYGSETASTVSSRGEYFFPVDRDKATGRADFHVSSYDLYAPPWAMPPDEEFAGQDTTPSCFGEYVWTGFDYLGEPTPFNDDDTNLLNFTDPTQKARMQAELDRLGKVPVPSRSSYFGIIDLAGFPKDRYYLYQSRWRPDLRMAHILPHWNWPERVGQVTPVHVYSSAEEAELFLNGKTQGKRRRESGQYRFCWDDVVYQPGELRVVTFKHGVVWADAIRRTTGQPAALDLQRFQSPREFDEGDLFFITVRVVDEKGETVPRSHPKIEFDLSGPGEIAAVDNGDPTLLAPFQASQIPAFNGLALVVIRPDREKPGTIVLTARSEGFSPQTLNISTR